MLKKSAQFFSVILHPILMPLIGISLLLFTGSFISFVPPQTKKLILLIFFTGTLLLPLIMLILLWFRGIISNMKLDERSERVFPYAMTFIFYLFTYFLLLRIPVYYIMRSFMLGGLVSLLILMALNFKWKISAHMTGIGGIAALILGISLRLYINLLPVFILTLLLAGILAASRLLLNAHKPVEVYVGFLLGFGVMMGFMA